MPLGCTHLWRPGPRLLLVTLLWYPREAAAVTSFKLFSRSTNPSRHGAAHSTDATPQQPEPQLAKAAEGFDLCPRLDVPQPAKKPVRRHGVHDMVLIGPPKDYGHGRTTRYFTNKNDKALTRLVMHSRPLDLKKVPPGDWRHALELLYLQTPQHDVKTANDYVTIVIPPTAAHKLREDPHHNIWAIKSRTGAMIRMLSFPDGFTELQLEGEKTAVEAAAADILNISSNASVSIRPARLSHGAGHLVETHSKPEYISAYRIQRSERTRYALRVPAHGIPKPVIWSTELLERYVAALTYGSVLPGSQWGLYPDTVMPHHDVVIHILHKVFNDPTAASCISLSAFKMAIYYMAKAGTQYIVDVRTLMRRAGVLGVGVDVETYNIMADLAVRNKDLRCFQTTIRSMEKGNVRPNLRTWTLFLRMLDAEEVKRYVLHVMEKRGLFHIPAATTMVADCMAAHDAYRFIRQGQSLDDFRQHQTRLYGPEWRSRGALRSVLDQLGRHGRFEDMKILLEESFSRPETTPDVHTLGIVLLHCKLRVNLHAATDFLAMFEKHGMLLMSPVVCQYLFDMAFKKKQPHCIDVVWRYACLLDMTTVEMRAKATRIRASGLKTTLYQSWWSLFSAATEPKGLGKTLLQTAHQSRQLLVDDFQRIHGPEENSPLDSPQAISVLVAWYRELNKERAPREYITKLWAEAIERDTQSLQAIKDGREFTFKPVAIELRLKRPKRPDPESPCRPWQVDDSRV